MTVPVADVTTGAGKLQQSDIGKTYHVALGTPIGDVDNMMGYVLAPKAMGGSPYIKRIDAKTRDTLIAAASPNVTDRDLAPIPRVTQGDFSGGSLQSVFIDPRRTYDSDLEVRVAGSLQLRPAWYRHTFTASVDTQVRATSGIAVEFQDDVVTSFAEANMNLYDSGGVFTAPYATAYMDTDGMLLYGGDLNGNIWSWDGTSFSTLGTTFDSNILDIWGVYLGTFGRYLYMQTSANVLKRADLSVQPSPPVVEVPLGSNVTEIVDLVPFGGGVAILTNDSRRQTVTVYYHDGINAQLIAKLRGYVGRGIADCAGQLYVTAASVGGLEPPVLLQVSLGSYSVAARMGSQLPPGSRAAMEIGAPVTSGQYVYFTIWNPTVLGATTAHYIGVYDVLAQSFSHLGSYDANDKPGLKVKALACLGRAVGFPRTDGAGNPGIAQVTANQPIFAGIPLFAATGSAVGSLWDFNTPGVSKHFRRGIVHHAPLQPGEAITLAVYVDKDPTVHRPTGITPTATVTHTYNPADPSPATTVLNIPANVQGFSLYWSLTLTAGEDQGTTPTVYWVSVEVAAGWSWDFVVACTSALKTLAQNDDQQNLTAQDRWGLIHNAVEDGIPMTLWTVEGAYKVNIADVEFISLSPLDVDSGLAPQDKEFLVRLVLTETAA